VIIPLGAATYGLAAMFTAMWISALVIAALSWPINILPRMRRFIAQPAVIGTFLVLVAITIGNSIFAQIVGAAGSKHYASGGNYIIAAIPFIAALVFTVLFPKSRWRPVVLIGGAAVAILVAGGFGQTNFQPVTGAAWFRVPTFQPFGFEFSIGAILLVFAGFFVNLFEGIGVYKVFAEDIGGQTITDRRVGGGLFTEGIGSAIGGLFGGMGATTYAQNMGSIAVTRVGTRYQVTAAGVLLVLMAFCGKFEVAVASLPGPVIGGLLFTTVALLLMQGLRTVGTALTTGVHIYAIGGGVLLGTGLMSVPPAVFAKAPTVLRPFVSSPLIVGLFMAVLILIVFGWVDRRDRNRVEGADQRRVVDSLGDEEAGVKGSIPGDE
jgi:xanthine/uracil permease